MCHDWLVYIASLKEIEIISNVPKSKYANTSNEYGAKDGCNSRIEIYLINCHVYIIYDLQYNLGMFLF